MSRRRAPPPFPSAEPTPAVATKEVLRRLKQVPQRPASLQHPKTWIFAAQSIADYVAVAPAWLARVHSRVRRYPQPFRRVAVPSWDGVRLTAWLGVHRDAQTHKPLPREGILFVPGIFTTKDNAVHRARALRFFNELGYHVLALDLRGMGESTRVFNTAGWKESEDVESALEYFRAHAPLEKVHVYGESLGAVGAILAAARQAGRGFRLVDGAIIAVSPFPDARRVVRHLVKGPPKSETFFLAQWFSLRLLELGGRRYPDFHAYLRDAARHYGVTLAELYRRSSCAPALRRVNVPCLLVSADDDPVVPARELRLFEEALRGRSNPALWRLPWGSHCLFELLDPDWFWAVLHEFFDFYCVLPPRKG